MRPAAARALLAVVPAGVVLWVGVVAGVRLLWEADPWLAGAVGVGICGAAMIVLGRFRRPQRSRRPSSGPERTVRCAVCTAEPYRPHASWCDGGPW